MAIITVGLPVYNAAQFLNDCLNSILNQTYTNFELLIIEDGSSDDSIKIIESFTDDRITFIKDGLNKGLPNRLNQITQLAKGDYIVRMDADDIMHKDRLEKQLQILKDNPLIDVLGSNAYSINEKNEIEGVRMQLNEKSKDLMRVNSFIHPTIMGKKKWFRKNLYNEKLRRVEDAELWYRAKQVSNFYCTSIPLLFYREIGGAYYKKYKVGISSMLDISKIFYNKRQIKNGLIWSFLGIKYFFKYIIYSLFNILNMERILVEKRNIRLSESQEKKATATLRLSIKK
jgi:glycosyltransferase involved in cell wall biosynthesis